MVQYLYWEISISGPPVIRHATKQVSCDAHIRMVALVLEYGTVEQIMPNSGRFAGRTISQSCDTPVKKRPGADSSRELSNSIFVCMLTR